jgi:hypothetical protein
MQGIVQSEDRTAVHWIGNELHTQCIVQAGDCTVRVLDRQWIARAMYCKVRGLNKQEIQQAGN